MNEMILFWLGYWALTVVGLCIVGVCALLIWAGKTFIESLEKQVENQKG